MFAVDPVAAVVDEAIADGVQLLVTHHPLFLSGVHGIPADDRQGPDRASLGARGDRPAGRAHERRQRPSRGLGRHRHGPRPRRRRAAGALEAEPDPLDKYIVFVPVADTEALIDAMAAAGAGRIGDYDRAAFSAPGTGTFRPLEGANPTIGSIGRIESVAESMLQMVAPRRRRADVVAALRAAHPYEEPAFDVIELADVPSGRGGGRVGDLADPMTLGGVRRPCRRDAADDRAGCPGGGRPAAGRSAGLRSAEGSGDSMLGAANAAGADVYLTSDLRHHRASEHLEAGGCALVDVAHWAAEWMWLPQAARLLEQDAASRRLLVGHYRVHHRHRSVDVPRGEAHRCALMPQPSSDCSTCRAWTPSWASWRTAVAGSRRSPSWPRSTPVRRAARPRGRRAHGGLGPRAGDDQGRGRRRPGPRADRSRPGDARRRGRWPPPASSRTSSMRSGTWPGA